MATKAVHDRLQELIDEIYELVKDNDMAMNMVISEKEEEQGDPDDVTLRCYESYILDTDSSMPVQFLCKFILDYFRDNGAAPSPKTYTNMVMQSAIEAAAQESPERLNKIVTSLIGDIVVTHYKGEIPWAISRHCSLQQRTSNQKRGLYAIDWSLTVRLLKPCVRRTSPMQR
jgi:hypothetical protein